MPFLERVTYGQVVPQPHQMVTELVALDTLKTWSLIVTLFGDLEGEELSGAQIRTLLGHIGIKPDAIRVALHRLKSDGWISSSKRGREAIYEMTTMARAETKAVAPDIYRKTIKHQGNWRFCLTPNAPDRVDAIMINPNLALLPLEATVDLPESVVLSGSDQNLPPWIANGLVPENLVQIAANLTSIIRCVPYPVTVLDRQAARLLILHHWRRIALRTGAWAHANFQPNGHIRACHAQVVGILDATKGIK
ncbi:MAG: hypothetical protein AAFQ09_09545 [Pseudomonadota bacterium]